MKFAGCFDVRVSPLLLTLGAPALAGDWYVDAVNGSNSNTGTSWTDAWKTITHAVNVAPTSGRQVFHIASGVYDATLGESFPIEPDYEYVLMGEGGNDPPVIDATGSLQAAVEIYDAQDVVLQALVVRGGRYGVLIVGFAPDATLRDVTLVDQTFTACSIGAFDFGVARGTLERVV